VLPADDDISSSFLSIVDESIAEGTQVTGFPVAADFPPPNSQSMVPNLNVSTTEADILMASLSGRAPLPLGLPAPSIRSTPLDEAVGRERIFAMAFPTLYPTGRADFNSARERKVGFSDYIRHLIRYWDGRFGGHVRWGFFTFNLHMRQKASHSARFYVSKASGLQDLNREELTEALQTDESLLPQIVQQGSTLTGTRPFWRNKGASLQAQARFLTPGMSPVFLTFSAADMQWEDLYRHFPGYSAVAVEDDRTRRQFIWDMVQNHPHIVAHYLDIRFRLFKEHVLRPFFGYVDEWCRYEWQARGSGHLHCLFWIPSAPPLDVTTAEARAQFAQYWGGNITAWNPDQLRPPDARNPASLASRDVTNTADQFAAFLNRLQVHSVCRVPYCLRPKKGSEAPPCRFFFPRPLFPDPVVTREINHKGWLFSPARSTEL
jgi:hypothetical protein